MHLAAVGHLNQGGLTLRLSTSKVEKVFALDIITSRKPCDYLRLFKWTLISTHDDLYWPIRFVVSQLCDLLYCFVSAPYRMLSLWTKSNKADDVDIMSSHLSAYASSPRQIPRSISSKVHESIFYLLCMARGSPCRYVEVSWEIWLVIWFLFRNILKLHALTISYPQVVRFAMDQIDSCLIPVMHCTVCIPRAASEEFLSS